MLGTAQPHGLQVHMYVSYAVVIARVHRPACVVCIGHDPGIWLSKALSYICIHGAAKKGLSSFIALRRLTPSCNKWASTSVCYNLCTVYRQATGTCLCMEAISCILREGVDLIMLRIYPLGASCNGSEVHARYPCWHSFMHASLYNNFIVLLAKLCKLQCCIYVCSWDIATFINTCMVFGKPFKYRTNLYEQNDNAGH